MDGRAFTGEGNLNNAVRQSDCAGAILDSVTSVRIELSTDQGRQTVIYTPAVHILTFPREQYIDLCLISVGVSVKSRLFTFVHNSQGYYAIKCQVELQNQSMKAKVGKYDSDCRNETIVQNES